MIWERWASLYEAAVRPIPGNGGMGTEPRGVMNTLKLIKARTNKSRAVEQARKLMAKSFHAAAHTDADHPAITSSKPEKKLTYRGVAYEPTRSNQQALGGRELRYRGVAYGLY